MSVLHPRHRRSLVALLLLLCIGLSGVVYIEATAVTPDAVPLASASRSPADQPKNPSFSMPPLASYAEVVARPLFSPTRRPAEAKTAGPSDFRLVGVVISRHERHALLAYGKPAHVDRVTQGQSVDGWTVKSIETNSVLLAQGDRETEIKGSAKPAPGPVGATPSPQTSEALFDRSVSGSEETARQAVLHRD